MLKLSLLLFGSFHFLGPQLSPLQITSHIGASKIFPNLGVTLSLPCLVFHTLSLTRCLVPSLVFKIPHDCEKSENFASLSLFPNL